MPLNQPSSRTVPGGSTANAVRVRSCSHCTGLPPPYSYDVPASLEDIVTTAGAVPATIALIDGRIKIGLSREELARLADAKSGRERRKISRRDLAGAIRAGADGGTTVAATMILAAKVGIRVL